jgi:tRNA-splicing ligase RtcB
VNGEERAVIVHRKGAYSCGAWRPWGYSRFHGSPGFVVPGQRSGRVTAKWPRTAAGRVMSRTKALQSFTWSAVRKHTRRR